MLTPEESREVTEYRPLTGLSYIRPYKTIGEFLAISEALKDPVKVKESKERKLLFLELLKTSEFHMMKVGEQADAVGVSAATIRRWLGQVPDEVLSAALKESRQKMAIHSLRVDAALIREATAEGGDAKHKELFYRKAEGWEPKQGLELSKKDEPLNAEVMIQALKDALMMIPEAERLKLLEEVKGTTVLDVKTVDGGNG